MPTYDYRCEKCGDFAEIRPIARRDDPAVCPACGSQAARALVGAPGLAGSGEASASHGTGCACCGPVKLAGRADGGASSRWRS
ncbi:zinc ribbon domain-containing protein [Cupriavidus sp. BIS7]|uniref:FmdB family zinc ribbon protein n=1 Tax=Cupriavidus sp. BIS7 TaxID=1217718 RepID=UPI00035C34C6|nr:zinc ribbon domain-containing protein [Cupriavidus sp. BIS7]